MVLLFKLETEDGAPAEPPTLAAAVPQQALGDEIPLGKRTLRVVHVRDTTPINRRCWSLRTWPDESLGPQLDVP